MVSFDPFVSIYTKIQVTGECLIEHCASSIWEQEMYYLNESVAPSPIGYLMLFPQTPRLSYLGRVSDIRLVRDDLISVTQLNKIGGHAP